MESSIANGDQPLLVGASHPSPEERLRESFRRAKERKTKDVRIPGWDELWITFRALDSYEELRDISERSRKEGRHLSEADREKYIAVDTLVAASIGSYAMVEGERVEFGLPLGVALFDRIFPPEPRAADDPSPPEVRPETDRQATVELFIDEVKLMMVFGRVNAWFNGIDSEEFDSILGKS